MYIKTLMAAAVVSVLAVSGARAELVTQSLPKPDMVGGKTLMQSLQERKSVREFGRRAVNDQTLADMLWAAVGVNRQDGKRTIPTALNSQDLTVYVLKFDGVWQYDARGHKLHLTWFMFQPAMWQPTAPCMPVRLIKTWACIAQTKV